MATKKAVKPSTAVRVDYLVVDEGGTYMGCYDSLIAARNAILIGIDDDGWSSDASYVIYEAKRVSKVRMQLSLTA